MVAGCDSKHSACPWPQILPVHCPTIREGKRKKNEQGVVPSEITYNTLRFSGT
uniref:Uncharacterized protein n=1 Tax=Rhizophora mucronata TaxID=61149 RepID=A0A2P2IVM2_RHIMU